MTSSRRDDSLTASPGMSAFKGGVFTVAMRWADRLLGLVSTLILARLLSPGDFGLVAMAMIVVGLVDVLLDLGVASALIQKGNSDRHDFDSAWTMRAAQACCAGAILTVLAPYCADYYNDPRVTSVMRMVAVSIAIAGFENIGIVSYQKDMAFGLDFKFFVTKRVMTTFVTIAFALTLRSYWALVLGSLVGRIIGVALSYWMHDFRPRVSFRRFRSIWAFSQWNLVMNAAAYASTRLDKFVLGRQGNAGAMGMYTLADEVASLPTSELLAPLGRVMFPAFVRVKSDAAEFKRLFLLAFSVQAVVGIPAGLGVALVAQQAVPLLLGDQWNASVPLVQMLGLAGVFTVLTHSSHYMLLALGKVRTLAIFYGGQCLALAALLFMLVPDANSIQIAQSRLLVAALALLLMLLLAKGATPAFQARELVANCWRPILASAPMVASVVASATLSSSMSNVVLLLIKVSVGVLVYGLSIAGLWWMSGRPDGAERYIIQALFERFKTRNSS